LVAERLGVSVPTVQRWVDAGYLKAWKTPGGHRRIDAESAEAVFRAQRLPADDAAGGGLRVLIVDDSPEDREVLAALCESALPGARVALAENGFQGLVAIGQDEPEIVITDIVMPKMDGIEMLTQLSGHCQVQPKVLVAVSSLSPAQVARRGSLPEGVLYLGKPLEPDEFSAALRQAVQRAGLA
jgi:excisionase family DNA binding protein